MSAYCPPKFRLIVLGLMKDVGVTTSRLSQVLGSRIASLLGQATRVSPRHDILHKTIHPTRTFRLRSFEESSNLRD